MADMTYNYDDFVKSDAPYNAIMSETDQFKQEQLKSIIATNAKLVGVKNFSTTLKKYMKANTITSVQDHQNVTEFSDQPLQLNTGAWVADDYGVSRGYGENEEIACTHPILIAERLENIDSGLEKIRIAFRRGERWRSVIVPKKTISSKPLIVGLADFGISVTSETATNLINYLSEIDSLNYDAIPLRKSVSRLGWIAPGEFSPYDDALVFDGAETFKAYYESVKTHGSEKKWLETAAEIRANGNGIPQTVLAASFASAMVEPLGGLPFFVHLWGGTETGKTVSLMLAASVWANPKMGVYIHTFNSTAVAQELSAGFVNSMPLILDELQIIKDRRDFDKMIYQLAEGVGRARGSKEGGVRKVPQWKNCILTTGEQPILNESSNGGAVNRIIEIPCESVKLFPDPHGLVSILENNYGFSGKMFVELMKNKQIVEKAKVYQDQYYKIFNANFGATEKQSRAAAIIMAADLIAGEYIFHDGISINPDNLLGILATNESVDQNVKALDWLVGWLAQNRNRFADEGSDRSEAGEVWGAYRNEFEGNAVAIIAGIFDTACTEAGFNSTSFRKWLDAKGYLVTDLDKSRHTKKLYGFGRTVCILVDKLEC